MQENNKIPKVIHFCWFGKGEYSEKVSKCIESWKRMLPDYKIKMWSEDNFDIEVCSYVQEAYENKKYAFVSDYARLYALYSEGGIYLDTDVEVLKSWDSFLDNKAFAFFAKDPHSLCTFVLGAQKGHPWMKEIMKYYEGRNFVKKDGSFDMTPNVCIGEVASNLYHFEPNGAEQMLGTELRVYPYEFVGGHDFSTGKVAITSNTHCVHWNEASWWTEEKRKEWKKIQKLKKLFGEKLGEVIYRGLKRLKRGIWVLKDEGIGSLLKKIKNIKR